MAISVPAPIAIPISALVSAGASLIPSPTIATLPFFLKLRITLSLPSGKTSAITSFTPACAPIAFAVFSLSPVSITTCIPIFCNFLTACSLSSLIISATAITPSNCLSNAKNNGVFPSFASSSALLLICVDISTKPLTYFMLPA